MPPDTTSKARRLMIAAPQSNSGKTVVTLALLHFLKARGIDIAAAKAGPDYIDPGFHARASGRQSVNLDPWAMTPGRLAALADRQSGSHLLVEAMMGLFDGAAGGAGSAADLASLLGIPVVLVVDAARQSHSIAALARGFANHRTGVKIAGIILNRVASTRHEAMLRQALAAIDMPVLGAIPRDPALTLPERHLGLVQAGELASIDAFIENAARIVSRHCDIEALIAAFAEGAIVGPQLPVSMPPGRRIAIARDAAFSFVYPHQLEDWRQAGSEMSFFSPLADEGPDGLADAIFLPGGYPELHGARLASAGKFKAGTIAAAGRGAFVYGECGGYMVLGDGLEDSGGDRHAMLGLLRLETSFKKRKLHLGYRRIAAKAGFVPGTGFTAHEFHYSTIVRQEGEPLFSARDALGADLGSQGLRLGNVMGSYLHIIDGAKP